MSRTMIKMLALTALFFGGIFGWKMFVGMQIQKQMQSMPPPVATVSAVQLSAETWTPIIKAVGSLRTARGVDVTPQEGGLVTELHFDSGDWVKSGQLLVQQYIADEQAQLDGLIAAREFAELNFQRNQNLIEENLVSEFDFDASQTEVQRTKAAETNLRLRIKKKSIRAPFAGQLGIRKIDLGQHIEPGDTIARLETRNQMLVDFPVPQREFGRLSLQQAITVYVDAWPGREFPGVIKAIEPQVERETRNIRLRGLLNNPDGDLVPGMFAQIDIKLPKAEQVVTAPQSAITYSPYGDSVYVIEEVVDESGVTRQQVSNTFVVTGTKRGDQVAVVSGLEAGTRVVTSGQQKLRNGMYVNVDNSVGVSNDPSPSPANN
jgi:membrane fusion protein (multidrug efflux system)